MTVEELLTIISGAFMVLMWGPDSAQGHLTEITALLLAPISAALGYAFGRAANMCVPRCFPPT